MGSPPRVREKRSHPFSSSKWSQDHPRVCGKNGVLSMSLKRDMGSPPRVREKLFPLLAASLYVRITPACAGKTFRPFSSNRLFRDHPRVCGKNLDTCEVVDTLTGSPPRVREKPEFYRYSSRTIRITPACAGKTLRCN